jgi:3-oxoadipate enol-lactonase
MPTIKVNDINMYYETHGDGEPLALIPGLSNDISDYERIIPRQSHLTGCTGYTG